MATRGLLSAQRSTAAVSNDHPSQKTSSKDAILQCLTRLNEKSTLKAAAEELSTIVRALDHDSLAALVTAICSTGAAWEPKPLAQKECIRALGQLPLTSCPVADVVLQQHLHKILTHLKKYLQVSPCLGPLDKDLVKLILRLLKSSTFQGTTPLLAAVASTNGDTHAPVGLLKSGAEAFLPYIHHLIGQANMRRSSGQDSASVAAASSVSAAGGTGVSSSGSGFIGCLGSKDWAVRRAAADAIRASVLLLGPALEPEGCWSLGQPSSLTYRCLNALEGSRFDKVKEARDAAREAAALLQELHRFVQEEGPDGNWAAWLSSHVPYAGCGMPTVSGSDASARSVEHNAERTLQASTLRSSPIRQRFQQAAVQGDVITEPGSILSSGEIASSNSAAAALTAADSAAAEADGPAELEQQPLAAAELTLGGAVTGTVSAICSLDQVGDYLQQQDHEVEQGAEQQQAVAAAAEPARRHLSRNCSALSFSTSRPASCTSSRPVSRRNTAEQPPAAMKRQSSHTAHQQTSSAAAPESSTVAGGARRCVSSREGRASGRSSGRISPADAAAQQQGLEHCKSSSSQQQGAAFHAIDTSGTPSAAWAPNPEEWQLLQQQLALCQAQIAQCQQQQEAMTETIKQMTETHISTVAALQGRIGVLEAQQQERTCSFSSAQLLPPVPSGSPLRMAPHRSRSISTTSAPAAAAAAGSLCNLRGQPPVTPSDQQQGVKPDGDRLFKSLEDWSSVSGRKSRPSLSVPVDNLTAVHRSYSGMNTPPGGLRSGSESQVGTPNQTMMATPGDLDLAYADALRGDKGEVHLLRLIQKTGPVWHLLSARTCRDLLTVFVKNVRDGVMLHRVLPWLWRLADEDVATGRPDVPWDVKQQVLEALHCCPATEDVQVQEKIGLLLETLKTVWIK